MLLDRLPSTLEDPEVLITRRLKAKEKRDLWASTYREAYQYAMPARETFSWNVEGQNKQRQLYDSTLQESTYTAANMIHALLFPAWTRWMELAPGGAIPKDGITPEIMAGLQQATKTFFDYLNISNFDTVIGEAALDLMVGTCALQFDEGPDNDNPFLFRGLPLSALEAEEGPDGSIETTWMCRKPKARDLTRLYPGLTVFDLSEATQKLVVDKPDTEVSVIQGKVYDPDTKHYYGIVIEEAAKQIIWRYDYQTSSPIIVARAMKVAGETYGRGRVLLALADAKTLDRMQEFVLKHAALQVAPPMTGVSDGVLNPYTASLTPNTIIPVASNDNGNPSLRPLDMGGNFQITETLLSALRERVRRTMIGPEPSEGAVKSATEISISDRNRLWSMNGEFARIQAELLAPIVARGVFILQKKGLIPKFKVNGREVAVTYNSPFSKSQADEDVMNLASALQTASLAGPQAVQMGIKVEDIPGWIARRKGVDETLIRDDTERAALEKKLADAAAMAAQQQAQAQAQGAPAGASPAMGMMQQAMQGMGG